MAEAALRQSWPAPTGKRPVVIIGAGGIVRDAHLPAYRKGGYRVLGLYDVKVEAAQALAAAWPGAVAFDSIEALVAAGEAEAAVFDLATPPAAIKEILPHLPEGSTVQIQKPMGADLADARVIRDIVRRRNLTAAVNFQLRFSPMMLAVFDAVSRGWLGEIVDLEVHLSLATPWHLFPFLKGMERVEIAVHSIHYLDLIRGFLGNPEGVYARTVGHPASDGLAQTRTSAILDYGDRVRCCLSINHNFDRGPRFQAAHIRCHGLAGSAVVKLGLLLDYPRGEPDELWLATAEGAWRRIDLEGGWFPDAFVGRMNQLQRFAAGEDAELIGSVEDAWHTMALVEAAYRSDRSGGTKLEAD